MMGIPNFTLSGYMSSSVSTGGSMNNKGSNGYFWSSTVSNDGNAYGLILDSSNVNPANNTNNRNYGYSVRCMAI